MIPSFISPESLILINLHFQGAGQSGRKCEKERTTYFYAQRSIKSFFPLNGIRKMITFVTTGQANRLQNTKYLMLKKEWELRKCTETKIQFYFHF